ncbi:hypothetical protein B0T22DRAFT_162237 [Podospora appendiculata]|uniref:F-box domain-containing protein n=1 Tax=Podospora appendiculata TaxID=314037 RepID=A0AAE0XAM2_9PEZI|nr:hypothetical protein B0T22DRAFT_162237 [Podospora appendiculata]
MAAMAPRFPPEVWHIVCSYLDASSDIVSFRRACQAFADMGQPFALPSVVLYIHQGDFDNMRAVANHPVRSKYVHALEFVPHTFPEPSLTLERFIHIYSHLQHIPYEVLISGPLPSSDTELQQNCTRYKEAVRQQAEILNNHHDIAFLAEVIPKLIGLRRILVSNCSWRREGREGANTPFTETVPKGFQPWDNLRPSGYRGAKAVLSALETCNSKLEALEIGTVSWRIIDALPSPDRLSSLTSLTLALDTVDDRSRIPNAETLYTSTEVPKCRKLFELGGFRDFLAGLPNLEALGVEFTYSNELPMLQYPAGLDDIIKPGHHWPKLRALNLGNIDMETEGLMGFLELHKDMLLRLELHDIRITTSWLKLLPDIHTLLSLKQASVWGDLYGVQAVTEDGEEMGEHWDLGDPSWSDDDPFSHKLGLYLVEGGTCPLKHANMSNTI